jgi:hypothetical protein
MGNTTGQTQKDINFMHLKQGIIIKTLRGWRINKQENLQNYIVIHYFMIPLIRRPILPILIIKYCWLLMICQYELICRLYNFNFKSKPPSMSIS